MQFQTIAAKFQRLRKEPPIDQEELIRLLEQLSRECKRLADQVEQLEHEVRQSRR